MFVMLITAITLLSLAMRMRIEGPISGDEGYLWYGTLRIMDGQTPLVDFRSYEPARYLWCALFFRFLGSNLRVLRLASHSFLFFALIFCGSVLIASGHSITQLLCLCGITFAVAIPQHKLFEHAAVLLFIGAATLYVEQSPFGDLALGFTLGFALSLGANIFLYQSVAVCLLLVSSYLSTGTVVSIGGWSLAGLGLGLSPIIFYLVKSPLYAARFFHARVITVLSRGSSNLPLPLPFPWRIRGTSSRKSLMLSYWFLTVCLASCLSIFLLMALPMLGEVELSASTLGTMALATFLSHHALSRADAPHIAQSSIPAAFLLCQWLVSIELGVVAFILIIGLYLLFSEFYGRPRQDQVLFEIAGNKFFMMKKDRELLVKIRDLLRRDNQNHASPLLALPNLAWMLPLLAIKSPVHDLFCVYTAMASDEDNMIKEISETQPLVVVIQKNGVLGAPEAGFRQTHPKTYSWLISKYCRDWILSDEIDHVLLLYPKTLAPSAGQ